MNILTRPTIRKLGFGELRPGIYVEDVYIINRMIYIVTGYTLPQRFSPTQICIHVGAPRRTSTWPKLRTVFYLYQALLP